MSERPILATIESLQTGPTQSVTVVLAYRDQTHSGSAEGSADAPFDDKLGLVAEAVVRAVEDGVDNRWTLEVRAVGMGQVGSEGVCLAQIADVEVGDTLFGVAGIGRDDVEKTMARAVLDAVNRRLIRKLDGN
jgi:hypothetical protein